MKIRFRFFVCLVLVFALFFCSVISVSASSILQAQNTDIGFDRVIATFLLSVGETYEGYDTMLDKVKASGVISSAIYVYSPDLKDIYVESSVFNRYLQKYNDYYGTDYFFQGQIFHRANFTTKQLYYYIPDCNIFGDFNWKVGGYIVTLAPGGLPVIWQSAKDATFFNIFNDIIGILPALIVAFIGFISLRKVLTWFGGIIKGM